jgi:hypothetical protein
VRGDKDTQGTKYDKKVKEMSMQTYTGVMAVRRETSLLLILQVRA